MHLFFLDTSYVPLFQILLAMSFGVILGIERTFAGRTAGMRTYGLVAIGACLITVVSMQVAKIYPELAINPQYLVSSIVTGIGFIGAGLIIFHESKISGLTTAAGIWVTAAIGIAVGFQLYLIAFFATFITLFNFTVLWRVELWIKKMPGYRRSDIDFQNKEQDPL